MECSGGGCTLQVMRKAHALGAQDVEQILVQLLLMMELKPVRMTDPGSTAQPSFRSPGLQARRDSGLSGSMLGSMDVG